MKDTSIRPAVRKLVIAAALYYSFDRSLMSDGDYDKLSASIAGGWDELNAYEKWTLESKESMLASGYTLRVSWLTAAMIHRELGLGRTVLGDWKFSKKWGVHWTPASKLSLGNIATT